MPHDILGMDHCYKCQGCGSSFVENRSFQIHLKHSARCTKAHPQVFKCFKCHQTFSELYQLQDHIRRHETITTQDMQQENKLDPSDRDNSSQDESQNVNKCSVTNDCISIAIHSQVRDQKPFECQHCGKRFKSNGELKTHIRTHTGDKPFKCQHCGKGFSQSGDLQKHIRTHTGDKPYKCQHCGKAFSQNGNLQSHIRTHH